MIIDYVLLDDSSLIVSDAVHKLMQQIATEPLKAYTVFYYLWNKIRDLYSWPLLRSLIDMILRQVLRFLFNLFVCRLLITSKQTDLYLDLLRANHLN